MVAFASVSWQADRMAELPLIPLSGTPVERGRQHGAALAERIAANVDLYRFRMREDAGLSDDELRQRIDFYHEVFASMSPSYAETMAGIAEGSRQEMSDIVMLNARFELLYSAWSETGTTAGECTAFGAPREHTSDGHTRIGQNWDWFDRVQGALVVFDDNGLTTLGYTEAGIAGVKIGVNSAGIGLCVNGLSCDADDWRLGGMPFHLRTSLILSATNLHRAVGHASLSPPSCSANFMIGAPEGVVDVESSPRGSRRIEPDDAVLVHANHFLDPDLLEVTQRWHREPITTFHRQKRLDTLLNAPDRLTVEHTEESLRDHDGAVKAVCRHPDMDASEHTRIHTAFSVIIDVDDQRLEYTEGPPCQSVFHTVSLDTARAKLDQPTVRV